MPVDRSGFWHRARRRYRLSGAPVPGPVLAFVDHDPQPALLVVSIAGSGDLFSPGPVLSDLEN